MRSALILWAALASACSAVGVTQPSDEPTVRRREGLVWLAHCLGNEGDPRVWPEHEARRDGDSVLGPEYAVCTWLVEKSARGILAVSEDHRGVSRQGGRPTLPFRPSWVPKHQAVYCQGDKVKHPEPPAQTVRTLTEFGDGFLVGFNAGEWGGGLYWYARDGQVRQHIIDENVVRVVRFDATFLVFTGLAHLSINEGHATLIEFDGRRWRTRHSFDLGNEPGAVLSELNGALLIATNERLLRLSKDGRLETLYQSAARWSYPTSLVRDDDGTLYLGTRGPVVRLRARDVGYTETWLAPPGAIRPRQFEAVQPLE